MHCEDCARDSGKCCEPMQEPRGLRISACEPVPSACKGLACLGGLGGVRGGMHALRAELDSAPFDALSITKPDAAARADQHCTENELGSERGSRITCAALPRCYKGERDWHGLSFIVCFDLLGI